MRIRKVIETLNRMEEDGIVQRCAVSMLTNMTFDMEKISENKRAMRQRLAALPVSEELQLLDEMREREIAIGRARLVLAKRAEVQSGCDLK